MTPDRIFFATGALLAMVSVAAGAFASHALKSRLTPDMMSIFELAARYQMYHAIALLACAFAWTRWPGPAVGLAGGLFFIGTLFFCGSLYVLSLTGIRWLGAITPFGGAAWLAGWLSLVWAALRH